VTWLAITLLNPLLPLTRGGLNIVVNVSLLLIALVIIPLYLSTRWNVGEAGFYLGFGLIFWALGDMSCNYLTLGSGGFCFLLRYWYPAPFLIVLRFFGGAILIMYLVLNPEVGTEPAKFPRVGRFELRWFTKVGVILAVLLLISMLAYQGIAKSGFGGEVMYVLTADYRGLEQPELVYVGIIVKVVEEETAYVLVREHLGLPDLVIGRIGGVPWDQQLIEENLGLPVEILGKLTEFDPGTDRLLYPGRIRRSAG
jgi:hypothetical protein